jgi:hypothetical protein
VPTKETKIMTVVPEKEFPAGTHRYRVTRLSVFEQMNLAADYRDIIVGLAMLKRERPPEMDDAAFIKSVEFIMTARAGLSPEVRERVMHLCFKNVVRKSGSGWSAIQTADNVLVFDDIRLAESVIIMYNVLEHNKLIDFFLEGPLASSGPQTEEAGPRFRGAKTG